MLKRGVKIVILFVDISIGGCWGNLDWNCSIYLGIFEVCCDFIL